MAGYTALMQENEKLAKAKQKRLKDVLDSTAATHNGKILQFNGDGALSIFSSAVDGVNCAVEIQKQLQQEPKVEHRREKQYMRSMIQDLQIDLKNIGLSQAEKERMVLFADSLTQLYIDGSYKENTGRFYYYARNFSTYQNLFIMTDGTLTQLKNSGGLRLIRKSEIVDSLQAYDNLFNQFRLSQEREDRYLMEYRDIMVKVFD